MAATANGRLQDLLEAMPDAILMANAAGRIVLANSQAAALFRYVRVELIDQPVELLLPERFRRAHESHRGHFFAQPRTRAMGAGLELLGRRNDGEEFPIEISLSPIETESGTMVLSAIRDVTERRKVEETLKQANRVKNQFLANMSHELRTPLNGIIGFSELLVDGKAGPLNDRQKSFLGDILGSGKHLLDLVNTLLDLSKIEAGRMDVHREDFRLADAVAEVCATVSTMAEERAVVLAQALGPRPDMVRLDRQKFRQILLNLLSNAIKFTDAGGQVRIGAREPADGRLELTVEDTGIGIAPHDLDRLFVEFQRLDPAPGRHAHGTGLGLALTKKLVELQGGSISLTSTLGHGTTATVILPCRETAP